MGNTTIVLSSTIRLDTTEHNTNLSKAIEEQVGTSMRHSGGNDTLLLKCSSLDTSRLLAEDCDKVCNGPVREGGEGHQEERQLPINRPLTGKRCTKIGVTNDCMLEGTVRKDRR